MTTDPSTEALQDERNFHVRDGWHFIRRSDGSVLMLGMDGKAALLMQPNDWASVVASMSAHGDTARSFAFVERFHTGRWTESKRRPQ